jgi:RNA polymerase-binding transcription factor DksA
MRKSRRSIRRMVLKELLTHLKSEYDFELSSDAARNLLRSNAGIDTLLSFRSDSRLDEFRAALERLESGTFGRCIACKQMIEGTSLYAHITMRMCPSCDTKFNLRPVSADSQAGTSFR